jgi:hypothetical protein
MTRMAARLISAAIVAVAILVGVPAAPAAAMCEGHISPVRPDGTPVGWFVSPPNVGQHTDPSGAVVDDDYPGTTPFQDAKASWSDTFGYGAHWNTYDLGCGPDAAHAPLAGPFTAFGNLMLEVAKFPVAVLSQVQAWLTSDPFSWLDPVTASIADKIEHDVWLQFFPLSLIVLGLIFVWQSRRADFNATLSATGWAVIVVTLSVFFLNYPQQANSMMTSAITSGSQAASSSFSNGHFADQVSRDIVYPQWLQGELGSSSSAVAQQYGEGLYAAQHLTWREAQVLDAAGPAGPVRLPNSGQTEQQWRDAQLPRQKDSDFRDLASKVKAADPTAYENLQGLHAENRLAAAFIMSVYTWTASLFMFMALAFLALALLMVRAVVIAAPIAAIVGVHERYRHTLKSVLNMFVAALVAVVKFTLAAGVFSVVVSGIIAAPTNQALKLLLVLVSTVVAVMVVKPVRTLKTVVPAVDPTTSYARQAVEYVLHRKAVEDGVEDGVAAARSTAGASAPAEVSSSRAEEESLDPIPATRPAHHPDSADMDAGVAHGAAAEIDSRVAGRPSAAVPSPPVATAASVAEPVRAAITATPGPTTREADVGDLYSRRTDRELAESLVDDLPIADKQLDPGGNEVFVVYRTSHDADPDEVRADLNRLQESRT